MRILLLVLVLIAFISCTEKSCDTAKKDFDTAQKVFTTTQNIYDTAVVGMNSVCAIFTKDTKSLDLNKACSDAKKVVAAANIGLQLAKIGFDSARSILDSECGVSK